jgi:exonuclease SbcC
MKDTQESLKKIDFDEKKYTEKKAEYENFYQVLEQLSSQISVLQNQIKDQEFALLTLQNQKKQFETEQQEQQKLMQEVDYLEHKKNILSQYITHLLQFLKPNIELLTSQYFAQITDGKYSEVTLDENYNILIDGKTIDLYSG